MSLIDRRTLLTHSACGFGSLALAGLLNRSIYGQEPATLHHAPKAKRIIFLFMQGGPSHVDSFDYKPQLAAHDGKMMDFRDARTIARGEKNDATSQRVMKSLWEYKQHGQCGRWASQLFPEISKHVDDLCFVHSLHTEGIAHGPATIFLHSGTTNFIRPSMGSWISYGLGSANNNLPPFVTLSPSSGNGGPRNYGSAFLPSRYQGTAIGSAGTLIKNASISNINNKHRSPEAQREQYELIHSLSDQQRAGLPTDDQLDAMIESYELAWRMQQNAPDILDISKEPQHILEMYGITNPKTENYGRQCLMARRLAEAGVRYIQVTYGDNSANPAWDQHSNIKKHGEHAAATDLPVAGLLADLKQRGLLEDTIVWWGGEFGRTPYAQKNGTGRDHNSRGFTHWVAGGGFKPGFAYGATDEFGHQAVVDKVHMHDLHATLLHQLGIDHERLTYRHDGRDYRLTDVYGHVVHNILQ